VRIGLTSEGTTVVGDAGDAPSSGAAADHAAVLRELLAQGADRGGRPTYVTLRDAPAAAACVAAGVGGEVALKVGHTLTHAEGQPAEVQGRVCALTDGHYVMQGPGAAGMPMNMGPTAVLAIGDIRLVLRSLPSLEWDPSLYRSVGLEPADATLVFVKSPGHFRVSYASLASRLLVADSPGAARPNIRALRFTRVTRPVYPLDDL
jgi:microcystin degradation protein MlrC